MAIERTQRKLTVDDFHRMADVAILKEHERVELIDGAIIQMSPLGSRHAAYVKRLINQLIPHLHPGVILDVQNPVYVDEYSEPQPPITLLKARDDFYERNHPMPDDILLLIEVADSSLAYDRDIKLPMYGRAGIVEIWLVDVPHQRIEVHSQPTSRGYGQVNFYRSGDWVVSSTVAELRIAVDTIIS